MNANYHPVHTPTAAEDAAQAEIDAKAEAIIAAADLSNDEKLNALHVLFRAGTDIVGYARFVIFGRRIKPIDTSRFEQYLRVVNQAYMSTKPWSFFDAPVIYARQLQTAQAEDILLGR